MGLLCYDPVAVVEGRCADGDGGGGVDGVDEVIVPLVYRKLPPPARSRQQLSVEFNLLLDVLSTGFSIRLEPWVA